MANKANGPEMGEYVVVTTTESDEKGPKKPGAIVIAVDNIKEHVKKVEDAGGEVLGE